MGRRKEQGMIFISYNETDFLQELLRMRYIYLPD